VSAWWAARSRRTQAILAILGLVVLGGIFGPKTPTSTTAASPTPTRSVVATSATPSIAPTATGLPRFITDMQVVDVQLNSQQRGLTCDNGQNVTIQVPTPRTARQWRCQGSVVSGVGVVISAIGDDQSHLERILIGVTQTIAQPSDAIAAEILGFYATLPYKDAEPARSRDWVKANVAASPSATLEGRSTRGRTRWRSARWHSSRRRDADELSGLREAAVRERDLPEVRPDLHREDGPGVHAPAGRVG
jgi:hypothetical protein